MGWLSGWTYRRKVTIDNTKVSAALTNFPVIVVLTSANFDFSDAQSDGDDIRFTSSDGSTLLKYEVERYDSANEKACFHVKIPSVSSSADTEFYLYYGNANATDGSDATNVWDSDFAGVWHMKDGTTSTIVESTSAGKTLTKVFAENPRESVFGSNRYYQDFSSDYAKCTIDNDATLTVEAEVRFNGTPGDEWVVNKRPDTTTNSQWQLYHFSGSLSAGVYNGGSNIGVVSTTISGDTTYHLAFTTTGVTDGSLILYKDGSSVDTDTLTGNMKTGSVEMMVGRAGWDPNLSLDAAIIELRVSNCVRSAAWIKASSHSAKYTLLSVGSEEAAATSASANDSYHEHTVGNVALTQSHSLLVAGAYHANVAEAVVLTQDLTVASAYHEHASDNLVLVQSLGLNSAYHDFVSEDVVLTQDHTLVVQSTYNENVSATVSLSQEHDLVVGSAYHALVSDNAVLTGVHGLAVAGAVNLNVAGDIALTQEHALSIADSYHVLASDNVATVQIFTLAIAGAYSLNVAGEPVLNINFNTVAADGEHLHTAENVVLTQEHNLYVSDCASIIVTGAVALTQKHTLSADSAFHTNSGDNISLSQYHDIVVGNTYHEQVVGEISLAQENNIDVADTYHALVSDNITLSQINRLKVDHCYHYLFSDNIVFAALPLLERTWVESAGRYRTIHSATRKTFIESASEYRRMAA